jgi:hypothetical protein
LRCGSLVFKLTAACALVCFGGPSLSLGATVSPVSLVFIQRCRLMRFPRPVRSPTRINSLLRVRLPRVSHCHLRCRSLFFRPPRAFTPGNPGAPSLSLRFTAPSGSHNLRPVSTPDLFCRSLQEVRRLQSQSLRTGHLLAGLPPRTTGFVF